MWKIILWIVGISFVAAQDVQVDTCKSCMSNSAYCIDERKFYICFDGQKPSMNSGQEPLSCNEGEFCTNSPNICEPASEITGNIKKMCSSGKTCGDCSTSKLTCASRTQVAFCLATGNPVLSKCAAGHYCSMDLYNAQKKFCAPQVVLDFYGYTVTCPSDTPVIPTPEPATTTPSLEGLKEKCEKAYVPGKYSFYINNDDDMSCKSYIYCERNRDMVAILLRCSSGYYNSETNICVATKPSTCPTISTTVSPTTPSEITGASSTQPSTISTQPSIVSTQPSTISTQPTGIPTDPPTIPTEPPTIPTEPPTIPTEPPTIPTEPPTIPTEPPTIPTEPPTIPTEPPTIPTEPPTIPTEPPTIPTEAPTVPSQQ